MDIFKQNKFLISVVFLLLVLNISSITMVLIGKPKHQEFSQADIPELLRKELDFDSLQINEYMQIHLELKREINSIELKVRKNKNQMFEQALKENSSTHLNDSLLSNIQKYQSRIEHLTYQYLLDLKKICKPYQRDQLVSLLHKLLLKNPPLHGEPTPPPPFEP